MTLRISSLAIRRPIVPVVIFVGLLIAGIASYAKLPVSDMPDVQIPTISIDVTLPGATPTEIESSVTRVVESALTNIGQVKHINSYVSDGVSNTQIEFPIGTNISEAMSRVRDQMIEIRSTLPRGVEEPLIQRVYAENSPILTYAVTSPKHSLDEISWFVKDQVARSLLVVSGVARIQPQGLAQHEIHVELDPAKLHALRISAKTVSDQLRMTTVNLPAGHFDDGRENISIRAQGKPQGLASLVNLEVALNNGYAARLRDIADVRDTVKSPQQLARLDHQPVVTFEVYRLPSASEIDVEKGVEQAISRLETDNRDMAFTRIQSTVKGTKDNYHSALQAFIEGAILAATVVFLFVRDWRATWIAGLVIPLSVIPTFLIMKWLGFSLNTVSLLALSLVSGILVDDAIVEVENIMRHVRMGKSPYHAAVDAADEIGLAVVATTLVIVAIFVPVSFMGGVVGQYFIQFGLTVAFATLFSLLVARLITPILAAYFLYPASHVQQAPRWVSRYQKLLETALASRKKMIWAGVTVLIASLSMVMFMRTEFMPVEDKSQSTLQVELPPGSRLKDTDKTISALTDILLKLPEVKSVYELIGGPDGETGISGNAGRAVLNIQLTPPSDRSVDIRAFEKEAFRQLASVPNVRLNFLTKNGDKPVSIALTSDNGPLLKKTAAEIEREMRTLKQLSHVSSSRPISRQELVISIRAHDAARLGVSTQSIAEAVRVATIGEMDAHLSKITVGDRQVPIRVLLKTGTLSNANAIGQLLVAGTDGNTVPLSAVADIGFGAGPASIARYDRKRQITLGADLNDGASLGEALGAIDQLPAVKTLPDGVKRYDTGDAELLTEMFSSFSIALISGVMIVFCVLILLFQTVLQPLTIMVALPLSIGGAMLALLLSHSAISLPAVIGILMLMGIVGKNGILLVDFIIEHRTSGMTREQAIMEACQQRVRPIVMTSLAMIAGMLPIVFGFGAGTAFRFPMAMAVIGGLVTSTALSLLFVPLIYTLIDDFEQWISPQLRRLTTLSLQE